MTPGHQHTDARGVIFMFDPTTPGRARAEAKVAGLSDQAATLAPKLSRLGMLNPAALAVVEGLAEHLLRREEARSSGAAGC
jgi:hypothetical protein